MPAPIIPPYIWPGGTTPNTTPFTRRDGLSNVAKIERLIKWINTVIVPYINENVTGLEQEFADQVNIMINTVNEALAEQSAGVDQDIAALTQYVNDAVASIVDNSVEIQDDVMTAVLSDPDSDTRAVTDGLYAPLSLTDVVALKADLTYVDDQDAAIGVDITALYARADSADAVNVDQDTAIAGHETRLDAYDTLTSSGRLGETAMDSRYLVRATDIHAVFIGSSNSTAGTWPENFCTRQGWVCKNFSIGGGGFTQTGPSQFINQINAAGADMSYDHAKVRYVFICDAGNDIRGTASVAGTAPAVFAAAATHFPNARIIILPALWGWADDNRIAGRMLSIAQRMQEIREAALGTKVEIVEDSWLWHWNDTQTWMLPGEVHYTANGYARVTYFMERFLRNMLVDSPLGWAFVGNKPAVNPSTSYWQTSREKDIVQIQGPMVLSSPAAIDVELGQLQIGRAPIETRTLNIIGNDRSQYSIQVFGSANGSAAGLIRSMSALPAQTYNLNASWRAL